ncbi:CBS domain-containing protein [Thiococcus pfennigii]|uniref:CBS domain-containing protein n=1 Tax=Thiococcus pfennigii TaxID=1057 RepID=UPI0019031089|nr:CBS domain-containing protein [Thiococcus pfennigii]
MTLVQAMRADVPKLQPDVSLREAAAQMHQAKCLVAPVLDERGRLTGSLSVHDLVYRLANSPQPSLRTIRPAVRSDPVCCASAASLEEVQALMCAHRQPAILVIDPSGQVLGVIDVFQLMDALCSPQGAAGPEPEYSRRVRGEP